MANSEQPKEGLGLIRWLLIWSSLSPVFVLWAIRGVTAMEDKIFVPICLVLAVAPALALRAFWVRAEQQNNEKTITVTTCEDQRSHVLVYLFAMLIPLYEAGLTGWRDLLAAAIALVLVAFVFAYMRLHYLNFFFVLAGFRIFTVEATTTKGDYQTEPSYVVISKRRRLPLDQPLTGYRLGGNVLVDKATQ